MSEPKVVRIGDAGPSVRVDRGTDWGNPFVMKSESYRNHVCDLFERYAIWRLSVDPGWLAGLKGENLACWCAPKRCHAEILLRLANCEKATPPTVLVDEVVYLVGQDPHGYGFLPADLQVFHGKPRQRVRVIVVEVEKG